MYPPMDDQQDMTGLLRRRNLFDPSSQSSQPSSGIGINPSSIQFDTTPPNSTSTPQESPNDRTKRLMDIYDRISRPAGDRYRDFLTNNEPHQEEYNPSKTQRLAAILAGISTNFSRGSRGQGAQVTQGMLEEPYNRAMMDYKNKAGRLKEGADVEEKDIGNRAKFYRDSIMDENNRVKDAETSRMNDARINNYNSQIKARDEEMKTKGFTKSISRISGNIIYTKVNSDGTVNTIDSGKKVDQTPQEKVTTAVGQHRQISGIDLGRQENYFDFTNPKIERRQKDIIDYRDQKEVSKEERANLEWSARQSTNPQKLFAQRALALRQISEEHPELKNKIDFVQFTSADPEVMKLMKAKIDQMNSKQGGSNNSKGNKPKDPRIMDQD